MIPYSLILAFVTIVAYLGRRYGSSSIRRISLFVVGSVLVLFAGLRDRSVGADTSTYIYHFYGSDDFNGFYPASTDPDAR